MSNWYQFNRFVGLSEMEIKLFYFEWVLMLISFISFLYYKEPFINDVSKILLKILIKLEHTPIKLSNQFKISLMYKHNQIKLISAYQRLDLSAG
jgi:hypothetical protein